MKTKFELLDKVSTPVVLEDKEYGLKTTCDFIGYVSQISAEWTGGGIGEKQTNILYFVTKQMGGGKGFWKNEEELTLVEKDN